MPSLLPRARRATTVVSIVLAAALLPRGRKLSPMRSSSRSAACDSGRCGFELPSPPLLPPPPRAGLAAPEAAAPSLAPSGLPPCIENPDGIGDLALVNMQLILTCCWTAPLLQHNSSFTRMPLPPVEGDDGNIGGCRNCTTDGSNRCAVCWDFYTLTADGTCARVRSEQMPPCRAAGPACPPPFSSAGQQHPLGALSIRY